MEINYLDLFSGIGGFHEVLRQAGFKFDKCFHSEVDKYACKIYHKHYPESECIGDVRAINVRDLPRAKKWVITGGWPCQDNSIAGKRKGQKTNTRSGLFDEIIRILHDFIVGLGTEVIFIGENVKGLYSVNGGLDFHNTITRLTYLNTDSPQLNLECQLLNTRWLLPQNRERLYFVGYSRKGCRPKVFPIGEELQEIPEKRARKDIAGCLNVNNQSGQAQWDRGTTLIAVNNKGQLQNTEIVNNIYANYHKGMDNHAQRTMIKVGHKRGKDRDGQRIYSTRGIYSSLKNTGEQNAISSNGFKIRRLTPTECERLQGFPDDWTKYGMDGNVISDTQRYKCLGNAVSVPIVKLIAEKIHEAFFEVNP